MTGVVGTESYAHVRVAQRGAREYVEHGILGSREHEYCHNPLICKAATTLSVVVNNGFCSLYTAPASPGCIITYDRMDQVKQQKLGRSAADRRKRLRNNLWPSLDENDLWLRKSRVGFTTIPRTITLIGRILDQMSGKGTPTSGTYLALWCWVFDEGFVEIRSARELAYESGFAGPRAEATWRNRMRKLEELGIIAIKAGLAGEFQYILMYDPIKVISKLYESRPHDLAYQSLSTRLIHIGADDFA